MRLFDPFLCIAVRLGFDILFRPNFPFNQRGTYSLDAAISLAPIYILLWSRSSARFHLSWEFTS